MREKGELLDWNDDRGFGFIRRPHGEENIFVHVKSFRQTYTRPRIGDLLTYDVGPGRNGKLAALNVDIAGANPRPREASLRGEPERPFAINSNGIWAACVLLVLLIGTIVLGRAALWFGALYLLAGAASLGLYAADKAAAEAGQWRTPERVLHSVDLAFGIIGGFIAQHIFRHKTAKPGFQLVTWAIAAAHGILLTLLIAGIVSAEALLVLFQ